VARRRKRCTIVAGFEVKLRSSPGWLGRNASFTSGALQDIALKSSVRHLMARRIGRNELGISDPLSDLMFSLEGQS